MKSIADLSRHNLAIAVMINIASDSGYLNVLELLTLWQIEATNAIDVARERVAEVNNA